MNQTNGMHQIQPSSVQDPSKSQVRNGGGDKNVYVHIDLKGARPQLQFWINFCRLLRDWGEVQGLILEWEDSYPLELLRGPPYHQEWVYSRY